MKSNKYSNYKILSFPDKVASFTQENITAPIYVRIKPINLCNHGCFFCVYSTGFRVKDGGEKQHIISGMHQGMSEKDLISLVKMNEILDDLARIGTKAVTYSGGGEPLMHPDIVKIMEKTLHNSLDLSVITNGQNLVKEKAEVLSDAKWVRISMDYTSPTQMKRFRNIPEKSFKSIINNIYNFAKIKSKDCDLAVNYIVHQENCEDLFNFAKLLKENGVENIRFSPMYNKNFYDYHSKFDDVVKEQLKKIANELQDSKFSVNSSYDIQNSGSHSSIRSYTQCYIMQTVPVIGADLGVYACHNKAYDKSGLIGSIKNISFSELWFKKETGIFIRNFNPKLSCMHECSNDKKNIFINELLNSSNDNFI